MNNLIELIKNGFFEEAIKNYPDKMLGETIFDIADNNNITALAFAYFLLSKKESKEHHSMLEGLLLGFFCYLRNAEHAAYSHLLRCLETNPHDIQTMKAILCLYNSPDNQISPAEFGKIAQQIILLDPHDEQALEIISETLTLEYTVEMKPDKGLTIKEKTKALIAAGQFSAAKKALIVISEEELKDILRSLALEKNICAYDFL